MNEVLRMNVLEALNEAGDKETGCFFIKFARITKMESQIALRKKVHDEIQVVSVLERVVHVDYERVF